VEATDTPARQTLDVNLNLSIDFWATMGGEPGEAIDGFLTVVSNEIYDFLDGHPVVVYHDHDRVVRVASCLSTIIQEPVLERVESEDRRKAINVVCEYLCSTKQPNRSPLRPNSGLSGVPWPGLADPSRSYSPKYPSGTTM